MSNHANPYELTQSGAMHMQNGDIHQDWCDAVIDDVLLDIEAYENVKYEPYDLKWLERVE